MLYNLLVPNNVSSMTEKEGSPKAYNSGKNRRIVNKPLINKVIFFFNFSPHPKYFTIKRIFGD